ncbi:sigma 54-interacting transcriptional regulator, partial [Escherichia coli]|uniref:sigma 54-interacting transcriptional regulator n=1 Tax=Escherichia coli TaxID=562 RepID=UPI0021179177
LFNEKIGDLPLELHQKLLNVFHEIEIESLASSRTNQLNVRVIAATNRDLTQMDEDRQIRRELF